MSDCSIRVINSTFNLNIKSKIEHPKGAFRKIKCQRLIEARFLTPKYSLWFNVDSFECAVGWCDCCGKMENSFGVQILWNANKKFTTKKWYPPIIRLINGECEEECSSKSKLNAVSTEILDQRIEWMTSQTSSYCIVIMFISALLLSIHLPWKNVTLFVFFFLVS